MENTPKPKKIIPPELRFIRRAEAERIATDTSRTMCVDLMRSFDRDLAETKHDARNTYLISGVALIVAIAALILTIVQ